MNADAGTIAMPDTLDEALDAMAANPDLIPVAGATDLFVHWPEHLEAHERTYLDLSHLHELRAITFNEDTITLGAGTSYWDVIREPRFRDELPILVNAARTVGAVQIQTRGTWAGNIANASPAADGVPALMACDATVHLASSARGETTVPLADFYLGYKQMRREPDELITRITLPRRAYDFQYFEKVGARNAQTIAKVGVSMTHAAESGWRIAAASVAPVTLRCRNLEAQLDAEGKPASPGDLESALQADGVAPIDDIRSTAAYRSKVLARIIWHALA